MLRRPIPLYNPKNNNSQSQQNSQQSIDQSSSADYSYKNKSGQGYAEEERFVGNNNHPNDSKQYDYENNPTRRGAFTSNEGYLVNQTKVKRPVISDGNNPYIMSSNSYKLERLSPYGTGQRTHSRENAHSNKSPKNNRITGSQSIINTNNDNRIAHDLSKSMKPQHLVSFGNITNRNLSTHSSKKTNTNNNNNKNIHSNQNPQQMKNYNDKENYQPNSQDSQSYYYDQQHISRNLTNKHNITKASTNPENSRNQPKVEKVLMRKEPHQRQEDFLLPIVNTNTGNHSRQSSASDIHNFNSNALSDASSINPHNESRISQADQSAYLKQKLIETHSKLIKQLEISKQLEDKFFDLKNKYEEVVAILNKYKLKETEEHISGKHKQNQLKETMMNNQTLILTQRVQQLVQENKCLKIQLTQMSQNMSQLILDNQSQKQKNQSFKYSSNDLKQCINQQKSIYNQEKAQLSQQLSQYNHQKALYQEEINKQSTKIQELKSDLENMRNKILQMITQKKSRQEDINSYNQEKVFLQNQLKALQEKFSKKDKEFTQKQQLCEIWRKKYSDAQEQHEKVYESSIKLQKQTKQLKNLNHELNIALRQQKQKNAQMLSEIINIQMQTKELKSKVSSLQQERKNLQDKLFENSQQKNILQQKLELEHNIQKLTHQYNSLSAIINKKDKQINDLSNQVMQKNNMVHKMSLRQKEIEIKQRELQKRERDLQEQKMNRMTSVKDFVNRLEQDKERNVGIRRPGMSNNNANGGNLNNQGQLINNQNNMHHQQQQNIIRQNVLNVSGSLRCESSGNTTPARQLSPLSHANNNHNRTPNKFMNDNNFTNNNNEYVHGNNNNFNQNIQQRALTPTKSLSGLKVNNLQLNNKGQVIGNNNMRQNYPNINNQTNYSNNKILICENQDDYDYQNEYQQQQQLENQYIRQDCYEQEEDLNKNFGSQQNLYVNSNQQGKYESVEDSLQLVRMINKITQPKVQTQNNNHKEEFEGKTMISSKSAQNLHPNKANGNTHGSLSQSKPTNKKAPSSSHANSLTQYKQRQLNSYKQQKQQYMSLLQQIGQLQTQNYNLNQEKKKIIDELDKIEAAKTKTKEMIARRRQLELWLLGNEKKNTEVKQKLKIYRGKVL